MNYDLSKIKAKCAELRGWKHYGCTGCAMSPCVCNEWIHADSDGPTSCLPNVTESADAALELVEWMDKKGNCCRSSNAGHVWWFQFNCEGGGHEAEADTFPLAVCLAFLKANNIEPESL